MAELLTPGVYCREVQPKSRPLEAVGTRVAGFIGCAPDASKDVGIARPVRDWQDFCRRFYPDDAKPTDLAYAVYGFFANGGGYCYISNIGKTGKVAGDARKGGGVQAFDTYDEISMIAAPGFTDPVSYRALVDHAEKHQDRVAILDCATNVSNVIELTEPATVAPGGKPDAPDAKPSASNKAKGPPRSSFAACYYPNILMSRFDGDGTISVPPSGHMAGIYANNDARIGVHNAPANRSVATAAGIERRVTFDEQGLLNQKGINVIRHFRDRGIKVWGARTLSDDPQWRYINVRRLFAMLRESIIDGCQWAVFMPNNDTSRKAIAFSCRAFLKQQWMNGALVGATEEQAFFVQCDESNNPPELAEAGVVNVEIGICPVRPAEFIVFHLGLNAGESADAEA